MANSNVNLTDKEASMFATLYGDVQVDEGVHSRLAKLFFTSMAPGTVCYWHYMILVQLFNFLI